MIKVILREGEIVSIPHDGPATWDVTTNGILNVFDAASETLATFPHGAWSGVMTGAATISE